MKKIILITLFLAIFSGLSACGNRSADQTGPEISNIEISGKVLVISDCQGTSVTISAKVTDSSGVESVQFWYRIGSNQQFASTTMELQNGDHTVSIKGVDFLGKDYGTLEFYITAKDGEGNLSQSPVNQDIQFLPCVNS
jgi:hypothetical protein